MMHPFNLKTKYLRLQSVASLVAIQSALYNKKKKGQMLALEQHCDGERGF